MYSLLSTRQWLVWLWLILTSASLIDRPLFPIDETRYVGVAWEMWSRNDFLVPYLNGEPYSHKPPLLFWLMQMTWVLFGVNEWSARLVAPLFSLASVFLLRSLAGALWPERSNLAGSAPFIMLGFAFWMIYGTLTMFDVLLVFFVLLALRSLWHNANKRPSAGRWVLFGLAIGGGILSKGPVVLLHTLPPALLAPWWVGRDTRTINWLHWYLGILLGISVGALLALSWAVPAGSAGGEIYREAILFGQTSGRLIKSFAHRHAWWWYLAFSPALLFPWCFWPPLWRNLNTLSFRDHGIRFCLSWLLPVFIALSLVSGKQLHYLLPLVPVVALLISRVADNAGFDEWRGSQQVFVVAIALVAVVLIALPIVNDYFSWKKQWADYSTVWGMLLLLAAIGLWFCRIDSIAESAFYLNVGTLVTIVILSLSVLDIRSERFDVREAAQQTSDLFKQNSEVAYLGTYHGQYNFYGRLEAGLISTIDPMHWAKMHPDGYLVITFKTKQALPDSLFIYHHPFRGRIMAIVSNKMLTEFPHREWER
ncbi:ArnT family glycosyltransferase [Methylotuvimicrobium sp.]|uniref:ArnT family glycosyltransferase n=1 Tax=Methylotuvimicrobium sp. TaxID=2822413 RepID=UPI003D6513DF